MEGGVWGGGVDGWGQVGGWGGGEVGGRVGGLAVAVGRTRAPARRRPPTPPAPSMCPQGKNVLKKEPMSKDVAEGDTFAFNAAFTSRLVRVKVGTVSAGRETEPENADTRHRVEEDRKPQVEAAIVRVMKARRVLDHNGIVAEVTRQLSSRFVPAPALVKKRIESLIDREFLERDPVDRKLYRYLA